jgi:Raf kinase inhibitor-like YbhB/YbcL family protein
MKHNHFYFMAAFLVIAFLFQCGKDGNSKVSGGAVVGSIKVTSTAFGEGVMIPKKYTCDDQNVSPQLAWTGVPAGTKSIALICDDPDAPVGDWVHWVAFNIPAATKELAEGVRTLPAGSKKGTNDFRKLEYGGPCPPSGVHRYYFKIYALDTQLSLGEGATKVQLLKAMEGHILDQGALMGRYQRR